MFSAPNRRTSPSETAESPRPQRMQLVPTLLLVTASLAASVLLILLALEVGLRVTGRDKPVPYPPKNVRPGLVEAYEPYGYRLIPSKRTLYRFPSPHPRFITVVSNRDGFRASRELEGPDPRPRILFLGASQLYGDGVEETARFTDVLETLKPAWRIDNLGMVGFGPDLQLRSLEAVGLQVKPAVVVFCMDTDSFHRVLPEYAGTGFQIPRYELDSGSLVTVPFPKPDFRNQLRISVAAERLLWTRTNRQWDLNQAILDRFEQLSDERHFRKAIVFTPGTGDTKDDQRRRLWLRHYAEQHATPYLDLSDPIHNANGRVFIEGDEHYNELGHQLVARQLDRFLSAEVLPRE
jgi:hypothetical protein